MFALIDCNNFYASCERLFRPDLRNKPIVILSNNDGCIIARSNEAKALGIKMGEPYFKVRDLCKTNQVTLFSSNYTLYGDLSARVMQVIREAWDAVEIYSIDEAFLDLTTLSPNKIDYFCNMLQKKVLKYVGIPTSIGIGKTKTLAKLANVVAKKLTIPVFNITDDTAYWLRQISIENIWGIGKQWQKKLKCLGILTASDLACQSPQRMKSLFNVVLQRTVMELNGISCLPLEAIAPNKSILASRSFGNLQTDLIEIEKAISHHCASAWSKLRKQELTAQYVSIFLLTSRFNDNFQSYSKTLGFRLIKPTDDLRELTATAKHGLKQLYKPNVPYKKVGLLLAELTPKQQIQLNLFHPEQEETLANTEKLMSVMESINQKYGDRMIRLAAEGFKKNWTMKQDMKSPCYTTRWSDLAWVKVK
ncbi:DNA polymerase V, subunit C [Legionella busanensis]|uniref:DNA polymerase V, subunit C n=1 Tax=Legionella busanensis TaxID=190655 RepID=A0A378JR98_9GAMM|nr:Y-family DNA polymerase [Legionella busanensis]STX52420.1 DNA polymerase V, subunit C [Legionella busanensis]